MPKQVKIDMNEVVKMYREGWTQEEIAEKYGVSNFTISIRWKEYALAMGDIAKKAILADHYIFREKLKREGKVERKKYPKRKKMEEAQMAYDIPDLPEMDQKKDIEIKAIINEAQVVDQGQPFIFLPHVHFMTTNLGLIAALTLQGFEILAVEKEADGKKTKFFFRGGDSILDAHDDYYDGRTKGSYREHYRKVAELKYRVHRILPLKMWLFSDTDQFMTNYQDYGR